MSRSCPACNRANTDSAEYCDDCGAEIKVSGPAAPAPASPAPLPAPQPVPTGGGPVPPARLTFKRYGTFTKDVIPLLGSPLVLGRFDASTGPVDLDLTDLPGGENVSRRHAELFFEGGTWMVKEISSTNGVFVQKAGEKAFSPRLQAPSALGDGDEVAFGNMVFLFQLG